MSGIRRITLRENILSWNHIQVTNLSITFRFAYVEFFFVAFLGSGLSMPFWDFLGSTVITSNYVRLTSDLQSKSGAIWNIVVFTCYSTFIHSDLNFLWNYSPAKQEIGKSKFSLKCMVMGKISLEMAWPFGMLVIGWLRVLSLDPRITFMASP